MQPSLARGTGAGQWAKDDPRTSKAEVVAHHNGFHSLGVSGSEDGAIEHLVYVQHDANNAARSKGYASDDDIDSSLWEWFAC